MRQMSDIVGRRWPGPEFMRNTRCASLHRSVCLSLIHQVVAGSTFELPFCSVKPQRAFGASNIEPELELNSSNWIRC